VTSDMPSAVAQDFFQRCFRGHVSSAVELLDPRVTYRVPGSHELAGTFEGPQEVASHVERFLRMTSSPVDVLQWEDWMIGVNNLAGLVKVRAQRQGMVETIRAIFLVTMSAHATISGVELFFDDQARVERFFK